MAKVTWTGLRDHTEEELRTTSIFVPIRSAKPSKPDSETTKQGSPNELPDPPQREDYASEDESQEARAKMTEDAPETTNAIACRLARRMIPSQDLEDIANEDDAVDYFRQNVIELSETIRTATWRCGSFAGIYRYEGYFIGINDAGFYGPHKTIDAVLKSVQFTGSDELLDD